MDGEELVDRVREQKRTELERLGSEKALIAVTRADLSTEAVLATAASVEGAAADVFEAWAADESDGRAAEAFSDAAATERDCYERIAAHLEEDPEPEDDALHAHLRDLDGTVVRVAAGLVARPLVRSRTLLQVVNFFINEADRARADAFRDLRAEMDRMIDDGTAHLGEVCASEGDWTAAAGAVDDAFQVAYDEYAEVLEGMGVDPKPVC